MYHAFLLKDGLESFILNDKVKSDRILLAEYSGHEAYKQFKPQKDYNEAARRLNKAIIGNRMKSEGREKTPLNMNVKIYEHMPKRVSPIKYSNYTPQLTISTIPEIRNVISIGFYYNPKFEYYVFYATKPTVDGNNEPKTDIWYSVKFTKEVSTIKACLYCINLFAKRFPGHTLLTPYPPVAFAFERGWVSEWARHNVEVDKKELWLFVYHNLSRRRQNCKVVYNPPSIHKDFYKTYLDSEVYRHYYRELEKHNPQAYLELKDEYINKNGMPSKVILLNVTQLV